MRIRDNKLIAMLFVICFIHVSPPKTMRISLTIILLLLPFFLANTQQDEAKIKYRGGMLFHSGYLKTEGPSPSISGACYGIGGQLTFTPRDHFRFGAEGYASYAGYRQQDGIFKLGWGGLLAGYQFNNHKLSPVLALTLGGGKVNDLQFIDVHTGDDEIDQVIYRKYPVMLASPALSAEYALKSKLSVVMKIDYLIPLFSSHQTGFASGPRVYLGIMFNRH